MNKNLVEIIFVLDRSGSMESTKADTEGGFNSFISEQRTLPGDVKVSLYQFDDIYETVYEGKPLSQVPALELRPRNGTALVDAIGKTIDNVGKRLASTPEEARPGKVVVVIMTDGGENASRVYNRLQIADKIKTQEGVYNWQFVFIGANQDAIATATQYGMKATSALTYEANSMGTVSAYSSLSKGMSFTRSATANACSVTDFSFDESDKKAQEEAK